MNFKLASLARFLLVFALTGCVLAGCAPATSIPTLAPTMDPATVVAAAVSTIGAQMTEEALARPTATPLPSATNTPKPTATRVPPTETPIPFTATPSVTFTPTAPALLAKANYPFTYPENKREYLPNEKFSLAVGFKNIGTVTWDSEYTLQLVSFTGEASVQIEGLRLGRDVPPGGTATFDMWAYGSETITTHVWNFQMYASSGVPVPGAYVSFSYKSITN